MHLRASKQTKVKGMILYPADVVKKVSDEIFVILKQISNICLAKGVFPDKLKVARVTPIFKKGNMLFSNQWINQITEAFSQGKYTLGTYIDLSKAFDTVNNNILLEKLKAYGTHIEAY